MPSCILKCQGCGRYKPFLIYDDEFPGLEKGNLISKRCPTCRTKASWVFAFLERRSGRDRRSGSDRRAAK